MKNKLQFKDLRHKLSWLLCLVAFLAVGQSAWARVYDGTEKLYFNMKAVSWWICGNNGDGNFAYFEASKEGSPYAWSAHSIQKEGDTYYVVVPAGTWSHVVLTRNSDSTNPSWQNKYNQTGHITIDATKNYIYAFSENGETATWDTYVEPVDVTITFNDVNSWDDAWYYIPNNSTDCNWISNRGFSPTQDSRSLKKYGQMTKNGNTYTVTLKYPSDFNGKCITFAKYDQHTYGNFHGNEAVHCDDFDVSKLICTSTTTQTTTNNTKYYGHSWSSPCTAPSPLTSVNANRKSCTQVNLSFSTVSNTTTLVVKYASGATVTPPSNGTEYTAGGTLGAGTVIYNGSAATAGDVTISAYEAYDFMFYRCNTLNNCFTYSTGYKYTAPIGVPTLSAQLQGTAGETSVTLKADISIKGAVSSAAILAHGFRYRVQGSSEWTQKQTGTAGNVSTFTDNITGLTESTTYEYQSYACNNQCDGTYGYSSTGTFTTAAPSCTPPTPYNVSGTAEICLNTNTNITLTNSQTGYTYELLKDGSSLSPAVTQTGTTGTQLVFIVSEAGTYTIKGYVTGTPSCNAMMNGNAVITTKGVTVTQSPATVHPYEPVTFEASAAANWTLSPASETAYISTASGNSTVLKAAVGTYTVTATASECATQKSVTVVADPDNCQ